MLKASRTRLRRLSRIVLWRLHVADQSEREIVAQFHRLYYDSWTLKPNGAKPIYWQGVETLKCPLDLWIYQEILFERGPDLIVETGTHDGGSALYFAHLCDLQGKGRIITIDIENRPNRPEHSRITYLHGSSTAPSVVQQVQEAAHDSREVLVVLDSDHSRDHVLRELELYSSLIHVGGYLIVEDTNVNGHPVNPDYGPGPMEAVEAFLAQSPDFEIDRARERFFLTFNPGGYLRRRLAHRH